MFRVIIDRSEKYMKGFRILTNLYVFYHNAVLLPYHNKLHFSELHAVKRNAEWNTLIENHLYTLHQQNFKHATTRGSN
jgi:hypothetical protein